MHALVYYIAEITINLFLYPRVNRKQYFELDEHQRERGAQLVTNRPGRSRDALNGAMTMQTVAGKVVGNMNAKV